MSSIHSTGLPKIYTQLSTVQQTLQEGGSIDESLAADLLANSELLIRDLTLDPQKKVMIGKLNKDLQERSVEQSDPSLDKVKGLVQNILTSATQLEIFEQANKFTNLINELIKKGGVTDKSMQKITTWMRENGPVLAQMGPMATARLDPLITVVHQGLLEKLDAYSKRKDMNDDTLKEIARFLNSSSPWFKNIGPEGLEKLFSVIEAVENNTQVSPEIREKLYQVFDRILPVFKGLENRLPQELRIKVLSQLPADTEWSKKDSLVTLRGFIASDSDKIGYEALAEWISHRKPSLDSLGLTSMEIKQIAPHLEKELRIKVLSQLPADTEKSRRASLVILREFIASDAEIGNEALAGWISHHKLPLQSLGLTPQDIEQISPFLEYVNLKGLDQQTILVSITMFPKMQTLVFSDFPAKNPEEMELVFTIFRSVPAQIGYPALAEWIEKNELALTDLNLMPEEFIELPSHLKYVNLDAADSEEWGDAEIQNFLQGFEKMETLVLSGVNISSLPERVSLVKKLQVNNCPLLQSSPPLPIATVVTFRNCSSLRTMPETLPSVETLDLSFCPVEKLPSGMKKLKKAELESCDHLEDFPSDMPDIVASLKRLNLKGTRFSELPNGMINLQELDITGALISSLPEDLRSLRKLFITPDSDIDRHLNNVQTQYTHLVME